MAFLRTKLLKPVLSHSPQHPLIFTVIANEHPNGLKSAPYRLNMCEGEVKRVLSSAKDGGGIETVVRIGQSFVAPK